MNPYHPPSISENFSAVSKTGKYLAITGALLQLAPFVALFVVIIGMKQAFSALAHTGADVGALAGHIGEVLVATTIGLIGSLIGLGIFFVGVIKYCYRAPWCFWFLLVYGILSIAAFPIGTVIGIGLIVYAAKKKQEFYPAKADTPSLPPEIASAE